MLASTLATPCAFLPGTVLGLEEVERRIQAQREAIRALQLGVPSHVTVRVIESDAPALAVERLWV